MDEVKFIQEVLTNLGTWLQEHHADRTKLAHSEKSTADLLTQVDLEVQQKLCRAIGQAFPTDNIVGEEEGLDRLPTDIDARTWIIDPIDGTYNFVRDMYSVFGISLGLAQGGQPLAGGIYLAGLDQLFWAEKGGGAHCGDTKLQVSDCDQVQRASTEIAFSNLSGRQTAIQTCLPLVEVAGQVRISGCAVAGQCAIAAGNGDIYLDPGLKPWDCAAGILMVEEAGGRTVRPDGSPIHLLDGKLGVLATNGILHEKTLELLRNRHKTATKRLGV